MKQRVLLFFIAAFTLSSCERSGTAPGGSTGTTGNRIADSLRQLTPLVRYNIADAIARHQQADSNGIIGQGNKAVLPELSGVDFQVEYINKKKYYVVEGDVFLTPDDAYIYQYYRNNRDAKFLDGLNQPFLVIYWDPAKGDNRIANPLNIRYGIVQSSFKGNLQEYDLVRNAMLQAAKDWERVCHVKFVYDASKDNTLKSDVTPNGFSFVIQKIPNKNRNWYAKAPMPHQKTNRQLMLSDRFFKSVYDLDGMMRHEIGHVLGFLHEHTSSKAPADCPNEAGEFNAKPLTFYDKYSVMHYLCEKSGHGTHALKISPVDSLAAGCVYAFPGIADACRDVQFAGMEE